MEHAEPHARKQNGEALWQWARRKEGHVAREAFRTANPSATVAELEKVRKLNVEGEGAFRYRRFQIVAHDGWIAHEQETRLDRSIAHSMISALLSR